MKFLLTYWTQIAVTLAALGYLASVFIGYWFKRKEIKYTSFHLERAAYIRDLYVDLHTLTREIDSLASAHGFGQHFGPTKVEWLELFQSISKQQASMRLKHIQHRILFPEKFGKIVDSFFDNVVFELLTPSLDIDEKGTPNSGVIFADSIRFMNYYEKELPKLIKKLEEEFRRYL